LFLPTKGEVGEEEEGQKSLGKKITMQHLLIRQGRFHLLGRRIEGGVSESTPGIITKVTDVRTNFLIF
jgi:hypothetical protein